MTLSDRRLERWKGVCKTACCSFGATIVTRKSTVGSCGWSNQEYDLFLLVAPPLRLPDDLIPVARLSLIHRLEENSETFCNEGEIAETGA